MKEAIIIHTLNSLDAHLKPYLAILSHDSREKEHLPSVEVLAKALEDEELRLSNQDKATANYAKKEKIKEHIAWASQETGMRLKAFPRDGGGEYKTQRFEDWMKENHVKRRPSAPYTPEQNRKAERLNYTLMSSVRSILAAMKLPKSLWSEILLAVCYLKNRSPYVNGVTPYESLNGLRPDLSHLRVLGARASVHIPKEKRKKLDERPWQGIHVGYEGSNQYRIYDPCTGKTHITRDVTIDEKNLFDRIAFGPNELVDDEWSVYDDDIPVAPSSIPITPPDPVGAPQTQTEDEHQRTQPEGGEASDNDGQASGSAPLRRSARIPTKPALYPGEIFYGAGRGNTFNLTLPSARFNNSNMPNSIRRSLFSFHLMFFIPCCLAMLAPATIL